MRGSATSHHAIIAVYEENAFWALEIIFSALPYCSSDIQFLKYIHGYIRSSPYNLYYLVQTAAVKIPMTKSPTKFMLGLKVVLRIFSVLAEDNKIKVKACRVLRCRNAPRHSLVGCGPKHAGAVWYVSSSEQQHPLAAPHQSKMQLPSSVCWKDKQLCRMNASTMLLKWLGTMLRSAAVLVSAHLCFKSHLIHHLKAPPAFALPWLDDCHFLIDR